MAETIRAALERLLAVVKPTYTDPDEIVAAAHAIGAARAALMADGPAVQSREPASVVGEPSDEELRDIWETGHLPSSEELANDDGEQDLQFLFTSDYHRWLEENPDAREEHENKCIRAVFNAGRRWGHQPAPPAEGEVAELVAKLGRLAPQNPLGIADPTITRAADLLEQRHPTPVPVIERPPLPCELDGDGFCYLGVLETDPLLGEPRFSCWDYEESRKRLNGRFTHFLPWNTPSLPAHALPLPAGEVQP